jgi:hypothetical protein
MASYRSGDPAPADRSNDLDDPDSQQPAYELIDPSLPPVDDEDGDVENSDGEQGEAVDSAAGSPGQQPTYELIDHSPPPPDDQVIAREEARIHGIQRGWLLGTFIGVFVIVIVADIVLSASLPAREWSQLKPEIDTTRTSLFAVLLVIIGYYFGERRAH